MRAVGDNKYCPRCGQWKKVAEFGKNKPAPDGLQTVCKSCRKIEKRAYYQKNKKKISLQSAGSYERHRERRLAKGKEWSNKNREKVKTRAAEKRKVRRMYVELYRLHNNPLHKPGRDVAAKIGCMLYHNLKQEIENGTP